MSDMGDKGDGRFQVVRYFAFVDVVGEGIGDEIVFEVFHVIFRGWFCSCAGISTYAEYCGWTSDEFEQWGDSDLCSRSITSRIRNMSCLS